MDNPVVTVSEQPAARKVFGLMAVTVIFSVIGAEIRAVEPGTKTGTSGKVAQALYEPPLILLGGTMATALLVLIAQAGETGESVATGFAGLATVTALLVNGGPVWKAMSNLFSSKGTGTTAPTAQTQPTA